MRAMETAYNMWGGEVLKDGFRLGFGVEDLGLGLRAGV